MGYQQQQHHYYEIKLGLSYVDGYEYFKKRTGSHGKYLDWPNSV